MNWIHSEPRLITIFIGSYLFRFFFWTQINKRLLSGATVPRNSLFPALWWGCLCPEAQNCLNSYEMDSLEKENRSDEEIESSEEEEVDPRIQVWEILMFWYSFDITLWIDSCRLDHVWSCAKAFHSHAFLCETPLLCTVNVNWIALTVYMHLRNI